MGTIVVLVVLGSSLAVASVLFSRAFPHTAWWAHYLILSGGLALVATGLAMWMLPRVWSDAPVGGRVFIWGTATVALTLVILIVISVFAEPAQASEGPSDSLRTGRE
jgi:hypothetical protein